MQHQYQDFKFNHEVEVPKFTEMIQTLISLQGGVRRHPLEVMERELFILGSKLKEILQVRRLKMADLKRKIDSYQNEACEQLSATQDFQIQLQKSLQQSSKECNKRLDKLERQRLQRDIQINSIIDEHILVITQQNQPKQEQDVEICELRQKIRILKVELQDWKAQNKKKMNLLILQLDQAFFIGRQSLKSRSRESENHILRLKKQLAILQGKLSPKIESLRQERVKSEGLILKQLEGIINRLVQ